MSAGIRGFYNDSASSLSTGQEGDIRSTAARALHVNLRDPSGAYVAPGGGTTDEAAFTAGASTFNPVGGAFNDSAAALTSGQQGTARATTNRALHVNIRDHLGNEATLTGNSLNVNVTNGAAGGTSMADKAAFTVGTTNGTPAFGLVRTDQPDLVADATGASFASTLRRGLHVNLRTQTGTELLGQKAMAGSIPVALASDQSAIPVTQSGTWTVQPGNTANTTPWLVKGNDSTNSWTIKAASTAAVATDTSLVVSLNPNTIPAVSQSGTWNIGTVTSLTQMNGAAIAMNTGVRAAGVQRVTICTDDIVPASQSGTWNIGTVTSLTQFNGVAIALNTGVRAAGVLRVTIATDDIVAASQSGTWNIGTVTTVTTLSTLTGGGVADAAADSGNPIKIGARYLSAPGTALSTGNRGDLFIDDQHGLVTVGAPHAWVTAQTTTIASSSSETTIVTAGAAGIFNDLQTLILTNATATACTATIKDATAGTTRMIIDLAANGGAVINLPVRHPQAAAAANWTCTLSVATVTVHIYALCVQRK